MLDNHDNKTGPAHKKAKTSGEPASKDVSKDVPMGILICSVITLCFTLMFLKISSQLTFFKSQEGE